MQTDPLQLEKLLSDESFQRWISKTASETENKKWSEWLNSDQKNHNTFEDAMRLWNAVQFHSESVPDADKEWNQLSNRLKFTSDSEPSVPQKASKKRTDRTPTSRAARWRYLAIAAGLLLIILLWRQLINDEQAEFIQFLDVRTDFGQSQDILLPERARIVLNANSAIEYPHSAADLNTITLELRGEAYFDVFLQDNEEQNFIVKTNDGEIHVLGTKFVVNTRQTGTQVVVETGSVEVVVSQDDRSQKPQPSLILRSGNLLEFRKKDRSLKAIPVNVNVYTSWRTDHLVFDNTPFRDIAQRLEQTYDVNIQVENQSLLQNRVSGSIENSDPEIIFQAIAKALGVKVSKKGNTVFFSNRI